MRDVIEDLGDGTAYDATGRGYAVRNGRAGGVMFSVEKQVLRQRPSAFTEEGMRLVNKAFEDAWLSPQGRAALAGIGLKPMEGK